MTWYRSSKCADAACVEVKVTATTVHVRDLKDPNGPVLSWTVGEWDALLSLFVSGARPAVVTELPSGDVQLRGAWMRGGPLTFTAAEWAAFTVGVYAGEFDLDRLIEAGSVRLAARRGWDVSTVVRDLVARATSTVDSDAPYICAAPLAEFEIRWMPDHSGIARESEATSSDHAVDREAPFSASTKILTSGPGWPPAQTDTAGSPTQGHAPTPDQGAASNVAGGATVPDEAVARAFHEAYERLAPSFSYETDAWSGGRRPRGEAVKPPAYLHFDGMTWPHPEDPQEVEWSLRYGTPDARQRMIAASIVAAYRQLVADPVRRRNEKIAGIRRAMAGPDPENTKEDRPVRNPNFHRWDPTPLSGRDDPRSAEYVEEHNRAAAVELNRCRWTYPDGHTCGQGHGADDHIMSVIPRENTKED